VQTKQDVEYVETSGEASERRSAVRHLLISPKYSRPQGFYIYIGTLVVATMTSTVSDIFNINPYEAHPSLSPLEADVLWEYAKLSQHVKELTAQTRRLSEAPDENLLARLRVLERKMGLVLTLFKSSVWGVINEQPIADPSDHYADTTADTTPRA